MFKSSYPRRFLGTSNSRRYNWILDFLLQLKNQRPGRKRDICVLLFYCFNFEKTYGVLKSNSPCFTNTNFNTSVKTKRNRKRKVKDILLEAQTMYFSSYKNRKLKVKPWWGPLWKRESTFCNGYFPRRKFF